MRLKKGIKKLLIILVLILLIITTIVIINKKILNKDKQEKLKVINEIKGYNYTLKSNKNNYYKKEFTKLQKILSEKKVNKEKYATSISKLFVIDFYSLDDKITKNDIGGVEFVHQDVKNTFTSKATDTIYKYVENDLYNNRTQKLPTVENVKIKNIENITYEIRDEETEAFKINIVWKYKNEKKNNNIVLIIVEEQNKLSIVELKQED